MSHLSSRDLAHGKPMILHLTPRLRALLSIRPESSCRYKEATNTNPNNEKIAEKYRAACGKLRPPLMKCANNLLIRGDPIMVEMVRTVSAAP